MVVLDPGGKVLEGELKPSSDAPTHLELYRSFSHIGGVVHTHSPWATSWSQSGKPIPAYGTTHADYFYGAIPCTRKLSQEEVEDDDRHEAGHERVGRRLAHALRAGPAVEALVAGRAGAA